MMTRERTRKNNWTNGGRDYTNIDGNDYNATAVILRERF